MKRLALIVALAASPAHEIKTKTLVIDHPYALETATIAMSGAGYMTITNTGNEPDRLIGIHADFPRVTIHTAETNSDGVTRMVQLDSIEIAPGETAIFAPGGMHVMFMGLDGDPFEEGERIPATLILERAGEIAGEFWIEPRDAGNVEHDHGRLAPDNEGEIGIHDTMVAVLGEDVSLSTIIVEDDAAVVGWQGTEGAG